MAGGRPPLAAPTGTTTFADLALVNVASVVRWTRPHYARNAGLKHRAWPSPPLLARHALRCSRVAAHGPEAGRDEALPAEEFLCTLVSGDRKQTRRRSAMETRGTDQRAVGEKAQEQEHHHAAQVHAHDHYHVSHHHTGGPLGEFEHRSHYHSHEQNHGKLTHAHDMSEDEERQDHDATEHVHDHDDPVGEGL